MRLSIAELRTSWRPFLTFIVSVKNKNIRPISDRPFCFYAEDPGLIQGLKLPGGFFNRGNGTRRNSGEYNPALGTGQIQIKDIHYVTYQYRTTWEMCKLLDQKYLHSSRRTIEDFYREATKNQWIKN